MKIFFTRLEANWFCLHGLFRVTAFSIINQEASELNRGFSYKSFRCDC